MFKLGNEPVYEVMMWSFIWFFDRCILWQAN